jgi:adenosine deaminase
VNDDHNSDLDGLNAPALHSVPHAGEMTGHETIWEALDGLGAERVGHGISCLDDPRLVERLRADRIPLEICPTSNVRTRQVPEFAAHPAPPQPSVMAARRSTASTYSSIRS